MSLLVKTRRIASAGLVAGALLGAAATTQAQVPPAPQQTDRAFLGINTEPIKKGDSKSGLRITYLFPHSSAKEMGIEVGDEIIAMNDTLIFDQQSFVNLLRRENIGATLRFLLRRGGEKVKIKGKVGSWRKTNTKYQEDIRKRMIGKPLPPLPGVEWWNAEAKDWTGNDGLKQLENKLSVIISFDSCRVCKPQRYMKISQMQTAMKTIQPDAPLGFLGLYQSDTEEQKEGREGYLKKAGSFFTANPPTLPAGVVAYPEGSTSTPESRDQQIHIVRHGVVILDPAGLVQYVQILDWPAEEFIKSYQKLMEKHVPGASKSK